MVQSSFRPPPPQPIMSSQGSRPVIRDTPIMSVQQSVTIAKFTSKFWEGLQATFGSTLHLSTAFHPQTDGQSERTIQILEDMLRMDKVHNVFYVSMLRKYELDPSQILSWVDVDTDENVSYEEGPVQILDT
ncbi:uncharacterized protein LOC132295678 [Cornus florida]|uniref:uncharacterized protein LOC132295678 n=1 Tax=Cornus florida TaxID=4283 RepID=UPI00289C7582|nr:uncharacterized protein LOC132295678 [Cornus florida]